MEDFSIINKLIKNKKPQPRFLNEMQGILKEKTDEPNRIIYDVYRNIGLEKDFEKIKRHHLRYDITLLYSKRIGSELPKTYGHYHNNDMMEIMEVISGKGWFLLQKHGNDPKIIKEAYLVKASANEKIIFPPGFGVISINPEKETLVLSNWLDPIKMKSDYRPYEKLYGACYYFYKTTKGKIEWEKNKNYQKIPKLICLKPKEIPELKITFDKPLYSFIETPEKLEFLNNPKKYKDILTIDKCYKKI